MNMKKLIAILLAVMLVLVNAAALATDVENDTDRDHFMSAAEAKAWGIVDKVL